MRIIILLVVVAEFVSHHELSALDVSSEWEEFKTKFGKTYANKAEEAHRFNIFKDKVKMIEESNAKFKAGLITYELGLNQFCDLTTEEFKEKYTMSNRSMNMKDFTKSNLCHKPSNTTLPDLKNWVDEGAVTEIKNQENCGVCWAFSAVASLESHNFIKHGQLVALSEQDLVDCTGITCAAGSNPEKAMEFVQKNGGINTESSYPYEGKDGQPCRFKAENIGAKCSGYVEIEQRNEDQLMDAVANNGPVSISVYCSESSFMTYTSGVYDNPDCTASDLNHAITIVGYGTNEDGVDYWLVRNSWGENWGEDGYMKIVRNKDMCGLAEYPVYPLIA